MKKLQRIWVPQDAKRRIKSIAADEGKTIAEYVDDLSKRLKQEKRGDKNRFF